MEKCSTQPSVSPPPRTPSPLLLYLPPSPPCPHPRPSALTAALLTPPLRGQWLTFKEKQGKRGARCHRIACLLTESLRAAPHKSKKGIKGIVSPRATCPTKIPLLCSLFSLQSLAERVGRGGDFLLGGGGIADLALFRGFLTTFFHPRYPAISLFYAPPTPNKKKKKASLSLDQHNLSLCTL